MTIDRELLDLLGLADSTSLQEEETSRPPGASTAEAAGVKDLLPLLALPLGWGDVRPELPLYRQHTYLAVAATDPVEVLRGEPVHGPDLVGFETHGGRIVLRMPGRDGRTYVVDAQEGTVHTYALADALAGIPDLSPPPPPLPLPDLADWCTRAQAEPWLADAVTQGAASPSAVDRAAAVGLLARLWTEPERGGAVAPRDLVRAWVRALPTAVLADVESAAVRRAWSLAERVAGVAALPEDLADAEVASLVRERDDLASVRRVLRMSGGGAQLAEALVVVDRVAGEHMSALADRLPRLEEDPDADRWHAVAWQEPGAWWTGA